MQHLLLSEPLTQNKGRKLTHAIDIGLKKQEQNTVNMNVTIIKIKCCNKFGNEYNCLISVSFISLFRVVLSLLRGENTKAKAQ